MKNKHYIAETQQKKEPKDQWIGLREDFLHLRISKTHQTNNLAH